jgi:hypothetical protein
MQIVLERGEITAYVKECGDRNPPGPYDFEHAYNVTSGGDALFIKDSSTKPIASCILLQRKTDDLAPLSFPFLLETVKSNEAK